PTLRDDLLDVSMKLDERPRNLNCKDLTWTSHSSLPVPRKKIFCRAAKRHKKPLPIREIVGKWQHPLRAEFPGPVKSSRIKVIASLAGSFDPRPQISGR